MSPLIWKAEISPQIRFIDNKIYTFKFGTNHVIFFSQMTLNFVRNVEMLLLFLITIKF